MLRNDYIAKYIQKLDVDFDSDTFVQSELSNEVNSDLENNY